MGDIFDRVAAKLPKQDIFDRVAAQQQQQAYRIQALNAQPSQMEQQQSKLAGGGQGVLDRLGSSMADAALGTDAGSNVVDTAGKNIRETISRLAAPGGPTAVAGAAGDMFKGVGGLLGKSFGDSSKIDPTGGSFIASLLKNALQPAGERVAGQIAQGNYAGAVGTAVGTALPFGAGGARNALSDVGESAERVASRGVPIAGQNIPVALADIQGGSGVKALQGVLEKTPVGGAIQDTRAAQLAASKQAIRNVAQQTSGAIGPMPEGASESFRLASNTVRAQAAPIYDNINKVLGDQPVDISGFQKVARAELDKLGDAEALSPGSVSPSVKRSLERAATAGIATPETREAVTLADQTSRSYFNKGLRQLTPGEQDSLFRQLPKDVVDKVQSTEAQAPFKAVQDARSAVSDALSSTVDRNDKRILSQLKEQMTDALNTAAAKRGMGGRLAKADQLTAKSYALAEIERAIGDVTTGTPESVQRAGAKPAVGSRNVVPQDINANALVEKLNDMDKEGTLGRALSPDHAQNLRDIADVLSRGQQSSTGMMGSRMVWRGLMAGGSAAAAGVGAVAGGTVGALGSLGAVYGIGRVVSRALATPAGSKALLQYLGAPQGSQQAAFWAARVNQQANASGSGTPATDASSALPTTTVPQRK